MLATLASALINYTTGEKKGYVYVANYDLINSFCLKSPPRTPPPAPGVEF